MDEALERLRAAAVVAGEEPASLVLNDGNIVELHTGRIDQGDIAIAGRRIAAVGSAENTIGPDTEIIDCSGLTLVPGFVDPHIHMGGSQLSIERLAEVLVPRGTAAICTDFYEAATIAGVAALEELLRRSDGTGLHIFLSPFHATALGLGAFGNLGRVSLEELVQLAHHERAIAIREWNYGASKIPFDEIEAFYRIAIERGLAVEGHLEGLSGAMLQASVALGVMTDHETGKAADAMEMVKLGVTVQIREGSGARDLTQVVKAITEHGLDPRAFSLATDEQELHSLARVGHMDYKLKLAVAHGVAPIDAIRMASLTAAQSIGVDRNFGSISPGKVASIAAIDDLRDFNVRLMVSEGRVSAREGDYLLKVSPGRYPDDWYDTVRVSATPRAEDFLFDTALSTAKVRVIGINPGSLITEEIVETVTFENGRVTQPADLLTIAVIDRHSASGDKGLGLVRGFDMSRGAIATTFNPGLMNLLVLGVDIESMAAAASRVVELKGGIVAAVDGQVVAEVATPLFGILSDQPSAQVVADAISVADAIKDQLGVTFDGLITSVGFAALAVIIPALKICDRGLVRVFRDRQEAVDLVVEAGQAAVGADSPDVE
ncbi:MAG TPA: adenine deaminase C-terminal domain-containing protein [Acidimicrobiia bacterium]|nr:adenine deaminase C-terminal domain-containing protein [Acidimicrobiia bacterium]